MDSVEHRVLCPLFLVFFLIVVLLPSINLMCFSSTHETSLDYSSHQFQAASQANLLLSVLSCSLSIAQLRGSRDFSMRTRQSKNY